MERPPRKASGRLFSLLVALLFGLGGGFDTTSAQAHGAAHEAIEGLSARVEAGTATAEDLLRRGELHRIERDWEAASRDYDAAARLDPGLAEIAVCRAALDLDRGEPARARVAIDRFLSGHSDHPEAFRLRSQASLALGQPLEAVRDLDRMIAAMPHPTPDAYIARARILAGCGERYLSDAIAHVDEGIVRLGPVVSLEFCAIELETRARRFDSALARLDRVMPQFERRESLLERRGEILAAAGRLSEARDAFAAALEAVESVPPERRSARAAQELETRLRAAVEAAR